jgi:hypothetical protein
VADLRTCLPRTCAAVVRGNPSIIRITSNAKAFVLSAKSFLPSAFILLPSLSGKSEVEFFRGMHFEGSLAEARLCRFTRKSGAKQN